MHGKINANKLTPMLWTEKLDETIEFNTKTLNWKNTQSNGRSAGRA